MGTIDSLLQPILNNFLSLDRDTFNGWYELKIGIPKAWVYKENDDIKCETVNSNDTGTVLKIFSEKPNVIVDDLFKFVKILIKTNEEISEKELEFTKKMEEMKITLENEAEKFYKELDDMKDRSFNNLTATETKKTSIKDISLIPKKATRGRPKVTKKVIKSDEIK